LARDNLHRSQSVTSRDVARAANVSQALVSRAFSGKGRIAPETRDRILAVAKSIGWRPNALAASMVTGDAPLVAVITARLNFDWRAQVLSRLLDALQQHGLKPLLFYANDDQHVDALMSEAIGWRTRGIIVTAGAIAPERASEVIDHGYFLAALNRSAGHDEAFSIATDNASGGAEAARAFLADGRQRLLVVAGPPDNWASATRTSGFLAALEATGRHAEVWNNEAMGVEAGLASAQKFLALEPGLRPDAAFVTNDTMALGLLDGLRGRVAVPDKLAVIGFDNLPAASWTPYQLTTFEQPLEDLVRRIIAHIRQHEGHAEPPDPAGTPDGLILSPPRLVERKTTRVRP